MGDAHYVPRQALSEVSGPVAPPMARPSGTELLPVAYFHVVFTVPAPVAAIALQNKALVYDILFKAAAETIRVIGADPEHLGAETGTVAIKPLGPAKNRENGLSTGEPAKSG